MPSAADIRSPALRAAWRNRRRGSLAAARFGAAGGGAAADISGLSDRDLLSRAGEIDDALACGFDVGFELEQHVEGVAHQIL